MFARETQAERDAASRGANLADVDAYFKQIRAIIKRYRNVVGKLEAIKKDKKMIDERLALIVSSENGTRYAMRAWRDKVVPVRGNGRFA